MSPTPVEDRAESIDRVASATALLRHAQQAIVDHKQTRSARKDQLLVLVEEKDEMIREMRRLDKRTHDIERAQLVDLVDAETLVQNEEAARGDLELEVAREKRLAGLKRAAEELVRPPKKRIVMDLTED